MYEQTLPPKRALSAYTFFVVDERAKIVAANSSLSFAEIGRELGRRWSKMPDAHPIKRKYIRQAALDRERYAREKAAFDASD